MLSLIGLQAVLLVDSDPGQLVPPSRKLVAAPGQLLLGLEQLEPHRKPGFTVPVVWSDIALSLSISDNRAEPVPRRQACRYAWHDSAFRTSRFASEMTPAP
jgi:hypothetical protein